MGSSERSRDFDVQSSRAKGHQLVRPLYSASLHVLASFLEVASRKERPSVRRVLRTAKVTVQEETPRHGPHRPRIQKELGKRR